MKVLNNVSFCCGSVCVHSIFKFSVNTLVSSLCMGSLFRLSVLVKDTNQLYVDR